MTKEMDTGFVSEASQKIKTRGGSSGIDYSEQVHILNVGWCSAPEKQAFPGIDSQRSKSTF